MSIPAATGCLTLPEKYLAAMLADCPSFQAFVGVDALSATPASDALAKIYFDAMPPPAAYPDAYTLAESQALRPCALIWLDQSDGYYLGDDAVSSGLTDFTEGGRLCLQFDWLASAALWADEQVLFRTFKNTIGTILNEMIERPGTPGFLAVRNVKLTQLARIHDKEVTSQGYLISAWFSLGWNNGNGGGR